MAAKFAITNPTVPTRLLNTPLMVSADYAEAMLAMLSGTPDWAFLNFLRPPPGERDFIVAENGAAVIPIMGGLTYRGYGWFWERSYIDIRNDFRAALADEAAKAIVFDIASPGGEVAGVFDLVDAIHAARGPKPIYAVANESAFSAAYAIASATDRIYLSRTAGVGSIGIMTIHADYSKMESEIGVKYTPIYAGKHKNDLSPHEPISGEALEIAQAHVNKTYNLFVETVARNLGMDPQQVRETEAAIYKGADAVTAGLAHEVLSYEEVMTTIADNTRSNPTTKGVSAMNLQQQIAALIEGADPADVTTAMAALGYVPQADSPDGQGDNGTDSQQGPAAGESDSEQTNGDSAETARADARAIVELCHLAGMPQMAPALLAETVSVDDARTRILAAKAGHSQATQVTSTVGAGTPGTPNPLVADAESRAKEQAEVAQ